MSRDLPIYQEKLAADIQAEQADAEIQIEETRIASHERIGQMYPSHKRSFLLQAPTPPEPWGFAAANTHRKTLEVLRRFCYDRGTILGYARVSTDEQNVDAQFDALQAAGVERIFKEKITGKARTRPELERLL